MEPTQHLDELARRATTREGFTTFLNAYARDCSRGCARWENPDLPSFFEAMSAWNADSDGFYANVRGGRRPETAWEEVANMLMAARIYE